MKHIFLILFSFFSLAVLSQAHPTGKVKVSKSQVVKSKTMRDLITSLPTDCDITEYQFVIETPQLKKTLPQKGNSITADVKSIVKDMKSGQKFFIENVKSNCKTDFKKNYIFVIE